MKNYNKTLKLIEKYKNNLKLLSQRNTNFTIINEFLTNPEFFEDFATIVGQTNSSKKRWYKGQHVSIWFRKVIRAIVDGYKTRDALANNNKLAGYSKDRTFHRKLFYKILSKIKLSIIQLCKCDNSNDILSLNYFQCLKFSTAGRPQSPYKRVPINENISDSISYDEIIINLWKFVNLDTKNCKSIFLYSLIDGSYDKYFKIFELSLNKRPQIIKDWFYLYYSQYINHKDDWFFKGLNMYRLNKILKNNGFKLMTRQLGNKPKTITKVRIEGLMQVDVKVTHCGDLKYINVGYWMVMIEVEHGLVFRKFQIRKPTGKDHVVFLNQATEFFRSKYKIKIITIQMDNAPEYNLDHRTKEEIVAHEKMVQTVGQWTKLNGVIHLNIKKGRKESNGKVENSNKMIDYELLPLIHHVQSEALIREITSMYDALHNEVFRRRIVRIIEGKRIPMHITPIVWLQETRHLERTNKIKLIQGSYYYYWNYSLSLN